MDFTEFTAIKNRFVRAPNACELFKLLSVETWKRIEYARLKAGVKMFETSITQNLIFSINAYNDQFGLNIEIFESEDEAANGNDLELIIRYPEEGVEFCTPIQAKKIYRNGKYTSMDHGDQIESLMNYAAGKNAKPLYLLYNFASEPVKDGVPPTAFDELMGCSLIPAQFLFDNYYRRRRKRRGNLGWHIPGFRELNPNPAFAWHELVCPRNTGELLDKLRTRGIIPPNVPPDSREIVSLNNDFKTGFFPLNTISKTELWKNVKDINAEGGDNIRELRGYLARASEDPDTQKEKYYPPFSPKSRIVLTK